MRHLDLFSGIGGFAYASAMVWENVEHTFVEYDPFCQAILKKHWPEAEIHGDIQQFVADAKSRKQQQLAMERKPNEKEHTAFACDLLTGGFPCQPFSHAGRRKGTADDRYLWPPMLECIALYRPRWVIAENVAGLASWNDGMVLETVCSDLEKEGYEVQPFVIPACAKDAPHRRDRVWIVAHANGNRAMGKGRDGNRDNEERHEAKEIQERKDIELGFAATSGDASDADGERCKDSRPPRKGRKGPHKRTNGRWKKPWHEVATALCRVDDGIPKRLDRNERFKALGNAIVPQVAAEIIAAMKAVDEAAGISYE